MKHKREVEKLIGGIFLAKRLIRQALLKYFADYDIGLEQMDVLVFVRYGGAISISEIASGLEKDKATISRAVKSLENKNLIKRSLVEKDKRRVQITLTLQGEKKLQEAQENFDKILKVLDENLSKEEKGAFIQTLGKLVDIVCDESSERYHQWVQSGKL